MVVELLALMISVSAWIAAALDEAGWASRNSAYLAETSSRGTPCPIGGAALPSSLLVLPSFPLPGGTPFPRDAPSTTRSLAAHGMAACHVGATLDLWAEARARPLWVADAQPVLYPLIRQANRLLKQRVAKSNHQWVLRIGCDYAQEEKLQRQREAKKSTALSTETKKPRVRIHRCLG